MKTMKKGSEIVRISDDKYKSYLDRGYKYTSKSEWKEKVRDVNKRLAEERQAEKQTAKNEKKEKNRKN